MAGKVQSYAVDRMLGNPKPIPDPALKGTKKVPLDKQLTAFKNIFRGTASRVIYDGPTKELFRPSRAKIERFRCLGIERYTAMLNCRLVLTEDGEQALLKDMVKILRALGDQETAKTINQQRDVPLLKYKVKGGVRWDRDRKAKIPLFSTTSEGKAQSCTERLDPPEHSCTGDLAFFQCPICQGFEEANNARFNSVDLDEAVKCKMCRKSSPSKNWTCTCGANWHLCTSHAGKPDAIREAAQGAKGVKRQLSDHEESAEGQGDLRNKKGKVGGHTVLPKRRLQEGLEEVQTETQRLQPKLKKTKVCRKEVNLGSTKDIVRPKIRLAFSSSV